jgi:hypothetical protein
MERFQAENEQDLNELFREQVGLGTSVICSHKEAAQLVRGSAEEENIRWLKNRRNKMEKATAVWECKVGDKVTMEIETGCLEKPRRVVQGKITRIPNRTVDLESGARQETIALDEEPYSINTVIDIKQSLAPSPQGNGSPASMRNDGETSPSPPRRSRRQTESRAQPEVQSFRDRQMQ